MTPNIVIELTVTDKTNFEKKALLFFDSGEDWFASAPECDVMSFFTGALMTAMERDSTVNLCEAQCYKVVNGILRKTIQFAPHVRYKDKLRSAFKKRDGTFEFL